MKTSTISSNKRKLIIIALCLILIGLGKMHYSQWQKKKQIAKEIAELQKQEKIITEKNKDLSDSLTYLASGDYQDKIARQQLNLKKEGEIVYTFNEAPPQPSSDDSKEKRSVGTRVKGWWLYFFK